LSVNAGVLYEAQWGGDTDAGGTGGTIGAEYRITPSVGVRASYGSLFRLPSVRQLFDPNGGNPALEPERSNRWEAGVDASPARDVVVSLTGFLDHARNFIERPAPGEPFANVERYRFAGVEVTGAWRPVPAALARLGYSYLDAQNEVTGQPLEYRPRHKLTLEGRYRFAFDLEAELTVRWQGGQVHDTRRASGDLQDLPDFTVVSLRAEQWLLARRLGFYAGVMNLFDVPYEEAYGYPQAGRAFHVGIDARR
jgi:outer membrane cobalamin receptor